MGGAKKIGGEERSPIQKLLDDPRAAKVRVWLAVAGAPLLVSEVPPGRMPPLEEIVSRGVSLAHRDAHVARVMPILLWRQRNHLDWEKLSRAATRRNERHALGFFLDLTGQLGQDRTFRAVARRFRDKRRTRPQPFFAGGMEGRWASALTRRNTPPIARKWGYLMNMTFDSFASAFAKHTALDGDAGGAGVISSRLTPRAGWTEAARQLRDLDEDGLLDKPTPPRFDAELFATLSAEVARQIKRRGLSEKDVLDDFASWRRGRREARRRR